MAPPSDLAALSLPRLLSHSRPARGIAAYCPQLPTADLAKLNVGDDVHNPDFSREPPPGSPWWKKPGRRSFSSGTRPVVGWPRRQRSMTYRPKFAGPRGLPEVSSASSTPAHSSSPSASRSIASSNPKNGGGNFVTTPFMTFHKHGAAGLGTIVNAEHFLFNDLNATTAKKWAATLTASPVLTTKLTNDAAYSALPCAYLVPDGDLTLPREYQEAGMKGWMVDTIWSFVEKIKSAEQGQP
ncbi:hypothetical protein B0H66DRAFT_613761 [Apodospora peruviana]|uniref:Uncharacterized protein n=1 Tax=Apodospora peruviana TaxID=516989 RepID=A0AAE0IU97_9PEZI|nr:hypothetical protein B0H66DRAFT_613761 [Apodospora peruviana]